MTSNKRSFQLDGQAGRLDRVLAELMKDQSRSQIQKVIKDGGVMVNHQVEKANFKLQGYESLEVTLPERVEPSEYIKAENIPLDIAYEDEEIMVVNKPSGMVVHPAKGHWSGTLVNALLYYLDDSYELSASNLRPGIVHRLDKDTSGLLLVAKTERMLRQLSDMIQAGSVDRHYLALANGLIAAKSGSIDIPLRRDPHQRTRWAADPHGKEALTEFEVLKTFPNADLSLVRLKLHTGRTHQIRVHLEYIGHPVLGDPVYRKGLGQAKGPYAHLQNSQYLHAYQLSFNHPLTGEAMTFEAPLPESMANLLDEVEQKG